MPYIHESRRGKLDLYLTMIDEACTDVGSYVYCMTRIATMLGRPGQWEELSFRRLNEAIGALECTKLEFYRRMVAPYEDKRCEENGDVF